jgi:hypothetical protein
LTAKNPSSLGAASSTGSEEKTDNNTQQEGEVTFMALKSMLKGERVSSFNVKCLGATLRREWKHSVDI